MSAPGDSSESQLDPSEFVKRIRELGKQQEQQDADRVRKLEEEILQGRSERLARRAVPYAEEINTERARSLSPEKSSTPQSQRSLADTPKSVYDKLTDSPIPTMEPLSAHAPREDALNRLTSAQRTAVAAADDDDEPSKPSPSPDTTITRSPTLSWQRRPASGVRRPLSVVATENSAARSPRGTPDPTPADESTMSRSQIAQSLGSKDPSWFKQTPDRGIGSAAYRREQSAEPDEPVLGHGSQTGKRQLPGMSSTQAADSMPSSPPPESVRSNSPSRGSSARGSAASWGNRFSTATSMSGEESDASGKAIAEGRSPLALTESLKFNPPSSDQGSSTDGDREHSIARTLAMSPTQGRISPERPPSPTKGVGGFVQSAMLKRSDSVSKRWSAQPGPALSRQNSTASIRSSGLSGAAEAAAKRLSNSKSMSRLEQRPSSLSRGNSMEPGSRPGSSHSNATITQDAGDKKPSKEEPVPLRDVFVKPALPHHQRGRSVASTSTAAFGDDGNRSEMSPPPSPSKRWSPTKSTWLESALNRPDSPKLKMAPPPQPSWMREINKAKQQRASVDLSRTDVAKIFSPDTSSVTGTLPSRAKPVDITSRAPKPVTELPMRETLATKQTAEKSIVSSQDSESLQDKSEEIGTDKENMPLATASKSPTLESEEQPTTSTSLSTDATETKSKPDVPPKTDFRSTLKPRQGSTDGGKREGLEFQNVFGKLRRTQTEKYVAPDELKSNVLRGKAGLQVTGGPQKTVHRDELKESLLKQKEAMKAKAVESQSSSSKSSSDQKPSPRTPEALAKRKDMLKSEVVPAPPTAKNVEQKIPEALVRQRALSRPKPPVLEKQKSAPEPLQTRPASVSSKLADRFNPALAGMLARGPPGMASGGAKSSGGSTSMSSTGSAEGDASSRELTHMTKGRARGPKRRAPTSKATTTTAAAATSSATQKPAAIPVDEPKAATVPVVGSSVNTPAKEAVKSKPLTPIKSPQLSQKLESSSVKSPPLKSPETPLATPRAIVESSVTRTPTEAATRPLSAFRRETPVKTIGSPTPLSKKPDISPPTPEIKTSSVEESELVNPSVKSAASSWGKPASPLPVRSKSPIKLPTMEDERALMEHAGLIRSAKPKPIGLGLGSLSSQLTSSKPEGRVEQKISIPERRLPSPPLSSTQSPPLEQPKFSRSPKSPEVDQLFADFFDELPTTSGGLPEHIDTQEILTSSPADIGKIRTLRKQIQEISGDGRLSSVPMQEEHVLFDESMYLCTHIFGASNGARTTEVYLWAGSAVPESTFEDAQLFGRRAAKDNQGKFILLRQGKETSNFFEALGGIVITRKGSRSRPNAEDYLLCGRRHLGHIAFDEVGLSLRNLCSGFPFIIASTSGKVFLWKGVGCSLEELAAARLIGMDFGSSGEIIELDEGRETAEFFDAFPTPLSGNKTVPRSADHWRYKASNDRYQARLFRIDQQQQGGLQVSTSSFWPLLRRPSWQNIMSPTSPQTPTTPKPMTTKVLEIAPFSQADLDAECIYVLDAFFEIYIVVGALSRKQHHAFSTALLFAQEYGILAASLEDRPFIPVSTVVLEGIPRDMKSVFRAWDDSRLPTDALMAGKLHRGKSLRIVGLTQALAATRR